MPILHVGLWKDRENWNTINFSQSSFDPTSVSDDIYIYIQLYIYVILSTILSRCIGKDIFPPAGKSLKLEN